MGLQAPYCDISAEMTPAQLRAARAMVRLTLEELAAASSVSRNTILRYENERSTLHRSTENALQRALEAAGVRFTERGVEQAA